MLSSAILEKIAQIAPNIAAKTQNSPQLFGQAEQIGNYGNFAQGVQQAAPDMQQQAANNALVNKMSELKLQTPDEQTTTQNADSVKARLLDGLNNFQRGFNENANNGFAPENIGTNQFQQTTVDPVTGEEITQYYNKTPMGRFGEAMGSVARFSNSPIGQAIIQGGISALANDDWREGLKTAVAAAGNRQMSNMYQNALAAEGIPTGNAGVFGNITSSDYNNFMNQQDKKWDRNYKTNKLTQDQENWTKEFERKLAADADNKKYREEKLKIDRVKAANKGKGGGSKTPKLTDNPNYRKALAQFVNAKGSKRDYARSRIIELFGVDPETKVKQVQKQDSLFDDED